MYEIFFTWTGIGLLGMSRNESGVSTVLLPTVDIGRTILRALSVARSELVYTIKKKVGERSLIGPM